MLVLGVRKMDMGTKDFLFGGTTFGNLPLYVSGSTVVGLQRPGLSDGNVSRSKTLTYFVGKPAGEKKKKMLIRFTYCFMCMEGSRVCIQEIMLQYECKYLGLEESIKRLYTDEIRGA